eukprot:7382437-Prymnesium_polylepis.1
MLSLSNVVCDRRVASAISRLSPRPAAVLDLPRLSAPRVGPSRVGSPRSSVTWLPALGCYTRAPPRRADCPCATGALLRAADARRAMTSYETCGPPLCAPPRAWPSPSSTPRRPCAARAPLRGGGPRRPRVGRRGPAA